MRCLLACSLITLANAGMCIIDSGEAIGDAMDAFMYTWAAMQRCGPTEKANDFDEPLKCEIDIASAVKSVNAMVNVLLEAVEECDGFHIVDGGCVVVAGSLTEHMAGLAASSGEAYRECAVEKVRSAGQPSHEAPLSHHERRLALQQLSDYIGNQTAPVRFLSAKEEESKIGMGMGSPIMCTVDMKNTAKSIFKATRSLMKMNKHCKKKHNGGMKCASDVLDIISSFGAMGEFLAGAVGECRDSTDHSHSVRAVCSEAISGVLENSMQISKAGVDIARKCKAAEGRHGRSGKGGSKHSKHSYEQVSELYDASIVEAPVETGRTESVDFSKFVFGLAAFLPVTVMVSFLGGRLSARPRSVQERGDAIPTMC